jgi:hypothetical protein
MPVSIFQGPSYLEDDGHGIELRPRVIREGKPRRKGAALHDFARIAKMGKHGSPRTREQRQYSQRCAVRIRYTKGGSKGKWYSHGVYIARESANASKTGFDSKAEGVDVPNTIAGWHGKNELLFRVIISPEFGDRMDLQQHTRDVLESMERDLGTKLEWVAVVHRNTDNPHVHVAIRGRMDNGQALTIPPEYIKEGARLRAEQAATNQLGYRLEEQVLDAQRREIDQFRFTGLDRKLVKRGAVEADGIRVAVDPNNPALRGIRLATENHLALRLAALEKMGLARRQGQTFLLDAGFEKALRQVQKTHDRQKIMREHGVLASARLPFRIVRPSQLKDEEGRILVHGQDEFSGNNYMLLESIRGEVLQVPHSREISAARKCGNLPAGHYVRIERRESEDESASSFRISDFGDAAELTQNPLLPRRARRENRAAHARFEARLARSVPSSGSRYGRATKSTKSRSKLALFSCLL